MVVGRKHIGQAYVIVSGRDRKQRRQRQISAGVAHSSYVCRHVRDHKDLQRVPVFEEDDSLFVSSSGHEIKVKWCEYCHVMPMPDYTWQDQALCAGLQLDMFDKNQVVRNKRVCVECPVRFECLEFGIATGAQAGMWGGVVFSYRSWETRERIETASRLRNE